MSKMKINVEIASKTIIAAYPWLSISPVNDGTQKLIFKSASEGTTFTARIAVEIFIPVIG